MLSVETLAEEADVEDGPRGQPGVDVSPLFAQVLAGPLSATPHQFNDLRFEVRPVPALQARGVQSRPAVAPPG